MIHIRVYIKPLYELQKENFLKLCQNMKIASKKLDINFIFA